MQLPDMAESAIEKLVMNNNNKDMIKAIAKTYTEKTQKFSADFIYGKGEGQVILLHGPPGTGKTLTAGKCYADLLFDLTRIRIGC